MDIFKEPAIIALAGVIIGAGLGYLLSHLKDRQLRKVRVRTHLLALRAEIEICKEFAITYRTDPVASPLYRLPTIAYQNSLPQLLVDAALADSETRALIMFSNQIETINRGLDQANEARIPREGEEMVPLVIIQRSPGHAKQLEDKRWVLVSGEEDQWGWYEHLFPRALVAEVNRIHLKIDELEKDLYQNAVNAVST